MFPCDVFDNAPNVVLRGPELLADSALTHARISGSTNSTYQVRRHNGSMVCFTNMEWRRRCAAFVHRIMDVIDNITKEKIPGLAARRIVAMVECPQSVRNGTICQLVCEAMCQNCTLPVAELESSVSFLVTRSSPLPATISLFDLCPEPIRDWLVVRFLMRPIAWTATELSGRRAACFVGVDVERLAALFAEYSGRLVAHIESHFRYVMPPAIVSSSGAFRALNYTIDI
jgi:hypothetical protein